MARTRRIGVLTGGGDVPGLNSVIKSVVYRSTELGYDVIGIRRGWEGLTHMRPGRSSTSTTSAPLDRINTRTIDRTGGTWLHTSRTNPRKMPRSKLPPWLSEPDAERYASGDDLFDLTPARDGPHRGARARLPRRDRRRRHAELRRGPLRERGGGHRDPQDHGQRRPGHRVLHRLLVGDHPGQGDDQPAADDARVARADRRIPDLRPGRRVLGPVHGLCHLGPVPHPGGAVRPRAAGRRHGRGPPTQPEPLRVRDRGRRCDVGGRLTGRVRRGGCLRTPAQGQRRRGTGRGASARGRASRPSRAS